MSRVVDLADFRTASPPPAMPHGRGEIRPFTQALNLCSVCGSTAHRASKCPVRPALSDPQKREI